MSKQRPESLITKAPKTKNLTVRKSNLLIEVGTSMSLMEQRITLLTMAQVLHNDIGFNTYTLSIPQLSKIFDVNFKGRHKEIEETMKKLHGRTFEIPITKDNGEVGTRTQNVMDYSDYYKGGELVVKLAEGLKEYLLDLKRKGHFTSFQLEIIVKLKSPYSMRLYELLVRDRNFRRKTPEWVQVYNVDMLKMALDISEGKYQEYRALNQKVISLAIKEINKKTDIHVEYNSLRNGRKVSDIEFTMMNNEQSSESIMIPVEDQTDKKSEVLEKIKEKLKNSSPEKIEMFEEILRTQDKQPALGWEGSESVILKETRYNNALLEWNKSILYK